MHKNRNMKIDNGANSPALQRNQVGWRRLVSVILWTVLFTLAYAQSPLYTSNQNQYFLHGYAKAGMGYLSQDWLASTLDPTPIFSEIVHLTVRYLPWSPIFYGYYAVLAGIYIFSIFGILAEIFHIQGSVVKRWFYLAALFLVHSAVLRTLLVRIFGPDWAYLLDGGVAGQRLLGSVFQPSTFGVLLILSIYLFLRGKYTGAVLCLVLAATVHPTYLLSAAMLTIVYMGITASYKKGLKIPIVIGITALLGVMPVLLLTFRTFSGTGSVVIARSRELLVTFRIPHHAIPAEWLNGSTIIKVAFILLALYLTRRTLFFHILCWPFAAAVLGTLIQILSSSDVLALLFPWRMSTWLVPLSVGVVIVGFPEKIWPWLQQQGSTKFLMASSMTLVVVLASLGLTKTILDYHQKKNSGSQAMLAFIKENLIPGNVYLIPIDMQDFRLETGAPAYVEFKSIPYKDVDVLEWYRRVSKAGTCTGLP